MTDITQEAVPAADPGAHPAAPAEISRPLSGVLATAGRVQILIGLLLLILNLAYALPPSGLQTFIIFLLSSCLLLSGTALFVRVPWAWWTALLTQMPMMAYVGYYLLQTVQLVSLAQVRRSPYGFFHFLSLGVLGVLLASSLVVVSYLLRPRTREHFGIRRGARREKGFTRKQWIGVAAATACLLIAFFPLKRYVSSLLLWDLVRAGKAAAVGPVLRWGADPNRREPFNGWPPLFTAAEQENYPLAAALLRGGADVNAGDRGGSSPLCRAAQHGHVKLAALLLTHGADPNRRSRLQETPLGNAAMGGNTELIRLLLAHGADPAVPARKNITPFTEAVRRGYFPAALALVDSNRLEIRGGNGGRRLLAAILHADAARVRRLLLAGADANAREKGGVNALMLAAALGHPNMVSELLRAGAALNVADSTGRTAVFWAVSRNQPAVVRVLLERGARVNAVETNTRETALMRATVLGNPKIVRLLLARNADPSIENNGGYTPLKWATATGKTRLVKILQAAAPAKPQAPR